MIVAAKTSLTGYEVPGTFEAVRAEALFVSALQPSGSPSPGQVRRAVAATLQRRSLACELIVRSPAEFRRRPEREVPETERSPR